MMVRILMLCVFLGSAVFFSGISSAETVRIATRENAVREQCRFFAPVAVMVVYGDELEVLLKEGDWMKVKFADVEGCIHKSAVTEKKIKSIRKEVDSEGSEDSVATREEVALAGKGFNPTVERKYREDNPELDFESVDSIVDFSVSGDAISEFIDGGRLNQPK